MSDHTPLTKVCTGPCKRELPATIVYFSRDTRKRDGLFSSCRDCERERAQQLYAQNIERRREKALLYGAQHRQEKKDYARQYRADNPEKVKKSFAAWQKPNLEKIKADQRRRYAEDPETGREKSRLKGRRRRARKRNLPDTLTVSQFERCLDYWGHKCAICGRERGSNHIIVEEHWIPLSDPRPDNPGTVATNILPMCHSIKGGKHGCNNTKNARNPQEWLTEKLGEFGAKRKLIEIRAYFDWVRQQDGDGE